MKIGILALQGDVREHVNIIKKLDADAVLIKHPADLEYIDSLIIPGGESTAISLLMKKYGLYSKIKEKHSQGMPIYGTCAGAILLAKKILGNSMKPLGLIDIDIERNSYGRQIDSFEADLSIKNIGDFRGIFIRAPLVKRLHNQAEILAEHNKFPVMIKQNNVLITTFHPELTNDTRVHEYFLSMAKEYKEIKDMHRDIEQI
ncbi:pyridoxal 5'-phosphate synthase glutaminase subunit PdxT [Candidatus Woesearchaeota archaeon]|nr:pyridoxal 5'-phosphate synthase glutaminase subunit PdxT [Candidatus Woesearchaeota archaeon]